MALIKKAIREKVKVKVLLMSPSGAGKTYTSLRLAKGMGGKTLLIDTEARRGLYYADEFDYDYVELKELRISDPEYAEYKQLLPKPEEAFAPENYIALIKYAVNNKYDNLIIDSLTHEWQGKGGILDSLNKMVNVKNDMAKWAVQTPRHNDFIYEILHSPINVIATVRGKDEYVLEQNDKGKNIPKKIGLGAVQRDGMEYEYTVTFMLDQESHIAISQKDNTHLFDGNPHLLNEDDGKKLVLWANSGEKESKNIDSYNSKQDEVPPEPVEDIKNILNEAVSVAKVKAQSDKEKVKEIIAKYEKSGNPNKIKELEIAKNLLEELNNLEV